MDGQDAQVKKGVEILLSFGIAQLSFEVEDGLDVLEVSARHPTAAKTLKDVTGNQWLRT